MYNPFVSCIPANSTQRTRRLFSALAGGDRFCVCGMWYTVGDNAHLSGDSSYDGYLFYDTNERSWFPEELD